MAAADPVDAAKTPEAPGNADAAETGNVAGAAIAPGSAELPDLAKLIGLALGVAAAPATGAIGESAQAVAADARPCEAPEIGDGLGGGGKERDAQDATSMSRPGINHPKS